MRIVEKLVIAVVMLVTFGGLVALILYGTGADDTAIMAAAAGVFSLFVIVAACFIIQDKRKPASKPGCDGKPDPNSFVDYYRSKTTVRIGIMVVIAVLLVFLALYSATIGPNNITMSDVARLIYQHIIGVEIDPSSEDFLKDILIWDVRMPRIVVALIAGAGLAIGGAVMQAVVKNPLADPFTTGISSGAVLGASLFILLGISVGTSAHYGIVANAFLFSLLPVLVLVIISRITNSSPVTVILVGTAVSYIFSSINTLIMMLADEDAMRDAFVWQVGSLNGCTWDMVPVMFVITMVISVALFFMSSKLNLLMSGDNEAKSLGLNVDNFRIVCLLMIALITASIVSFIGVIGFVGLIVPHFIRLIMGSDSRYVLPASMLTGASAMLLADILSRVIASEAMPVGVVLSFVGGPLFLLLIIKSRREAWVDEV